MNETVDVVASFFWMFLGITMILCLIRGLSEKYDRHMGWLPRDLYFFFGITFASLAFILGYMLKRALW